MVSTGLQIRDLEVRYDADTAIEHFDLDVPSNQITVLLGPSGCGKSTLLRAIAGLEPTERGSITWQERSMDGVPTHQRRIGLMFQQHALFPHRSVAGNVAFGLEMQRPRPPAIDQSVSDLLTLVGLPDFEERAVASLSGGEAQRVALARALAPHPQLLLLDEPLASLDRPLRERLVRDVLRLRDELSLTILYVTHDRDEAFALADELVIMRAGRVIARGTSDELWSRPPSVWVARFLGHDTVLAGGDRRERHPLLSGIAIDAGMDVVVPVTAARIDAVSRLRGPVVASRFTPRGFEVTVEIDGATITAGSPTRVSIGTEVGVAVDPDQLVPVARDHPR